MPLADEQLADKHQSLAESPAIGAAAASDSSGTLDDDDAAAAREGAPLADLDGSDLDEHEEMDEEGEGLEDLEAFDKEVESWLVRSTCERVAFWQYL